MVVMARKGNCFGFARFIILLSWVPEKENNKMVDTERKPLKSENSFT